MSKPRLADILDESPEEVVRRPPLPAGSYVCTVTGWREDKSAKKGTKYHEFDFRPIEALDDVDADELEAAGGIDGKTLKNKYWITEDAISMLDDLHQNCGLDLKNNRNSRRMRNDEIINSQVIVYVKHEESQDGTRTYANVARTAPVE